MKRVSYILRPLTLAIAVIMSLPVLAEHHRLPDYGPAPSENSESLKARQGFLRFVRQMRAKNNPNSISAGYGNEQKPISLRPRKILRAPWEPSGDIYCVVSMWEGMASYADAFWGKLDVNNGRTSAIYKGMQYTNREDAYMQGGVVRDNILYIPGVDYGADGMVTGEINVVWRRVDISTGKRLPDIVWGMNDNAQRMFMYGMTYDPVNDKIYGLAYDRAAELGGGLCVIDCSAAPAEEWVAEPIKNVGGTPTNWMAMICYSPIDGVLYGLSNSGVLSELDPENGNVIPVQEYDREGNAICFPESYSSTPACYSPYDKSIVFITEDPELQNFVSVAIDIETFEAYYIAPISPLTRVSTLYCADPYGDDNGPGVMDAPVISFEDNNLSGTYSFTAPETLFNGIKIDGDIVMHIFVDGVEIRTETVAPGTTVTGNLTLTQGLHTVSGYCTLGEYTGPETKKKIYVGNDSPYAPTNVNYLNGTLTWNAPSSTGVNNGYLDLSDVTYDVYVNGVKFNAEPITGTSYPAVFNDPATGRSRIQVTATANGVTSELSTPLTRVIGKGFELPQNLDPTTAQADLFETNNANHDAYEWTYYNRSGSDPYWMVFTTEYREMPNDWLFTPPMYFDSADDIYSLIVEYANARDNSLHKNNLEIYLCNDPDPRSEKKLIYSHEEHRQAEPTDLSVRFSVENAGTYYIGFYAAPNREQGYTTNYYRGVRLAKFRVQKDNGTSLAPADATDVKITPAPLGELSVEIEATLPTLAMNGQTLDSSSEVTLTAKSEGGTAHISGTPGQKVNLSLEVAKDGYSDIYLTPSTDNGEGVSRLYTVYTGIDSPLPPRNVKGHISEDNCSMTVTWDPVGNVGEHGGYVDTQDVNYDFYSHSTVGITKIGTAGKNCTYTFNGTTGTQAQYFVGPVAVNFMGTSINGTFLNETLGKPYITPMSEEFGVSTFRYSKWLFNSVAPYNNVQWSHITEAAEDLGHIYFPEEGALRATNFGGGKALGELPAPRVTTKDVFSVKTSIKYWNYAHAGHMELWGRTYENQEYVKLAELDPSCPANGEWVEWVTVLPESFANQAWIQVNLRCSINASESVVIDNYQILPNMDYDLQVSSVTGPYSAFVGDEPGFDIVVTNGGQEPVSGSLLVELLADGEPIETETVEMGRIRSGDDFEHTAHFTMLEDYIKYSLLEVQANVICDGDQNPLNNDKYVEFILNDHTIPIVRDLTATRLDNGQDVRLDWSTPDASYKNPESFEINAPLQNTEEIGRWISADMDGLPQFTIDGKRWEGDDKPSGWVVFNAREAGTMADPRLSPHSGEQMLIARSISYDPASEAPTRSFDFLVSPEVKPGSKVSFWLNTISSEYTETVTIWYSTTDRNLTGTDFDLTDKETAPRECGSFKWLLNFTKSGSDTWEICEFELPENAKYFAIVYSSFGQFAAMIDDITFEAAGSEKIDIDSYDVFVSRDGGELKRIAAEVSGNTYTHVTGDDLQAVYYVKTNVSDGDVVFTSPLSNPAKVAGSGIGELENGRFVGGGKGRILVGGASGDTCRIYDVDGRVLRNAVINSDRQTFIVDAGIYLVQLGDAMVKVVVR